MEKLYYYESQEEGMRRITPLAFSLALATDKWREASACDVYVSWRSDTREAWLQIRSKSLPNDPGDGSWWDPAPLETP